MPAGPVWVVVTPGRVRRCGSANRPMNNGIWGSSPGLGAIVRFSGTGPRTLLTPLGGHQLD